MKNSVCSDAGRWKTLTGPVVIGGDNLPSPVRIGLTDLPNIGGASDPPAPPPVPASLLFVYSLFFLSENTLIGWKNCKNSGFLVLLLVVGSTEQDNLTNGTPGIARILLHNKVSGLKNLIWQFSLPTRIKSWYEFNTCFSRILNLQIYKKISWNFMFHFL